MKRFITAMLLLCSTLMLHAAKTDKKVTITVGNESREYWLYVPDNVKAEAPLVVSLHGASGHDTDKSPFRTDVKITGSVLLICWGQGDSPPVRRQQEKPAGSFALSAGDQ